MLFLVSTQDIAERVVKVDICNTDYNYLKKVINTLATFYPNKEISLTTLRVVNRNYHDLPMVNRTIDVKEKINE